MLFNDTCQIMATVSCATIAVTAFTGCFIQRQMCPTTAVNQLLIQSSTCWIFFKVELFKDNKAVGVMKAGNSFTIEPMISEGTWRDEQWPDQWTAVTADGKRSAQFEQTLLVTETGCDILTVRREKNGQPWFMDSMWIQQSQAFNKFSFNEQFFS